VDTAAPALVAAREALHEAYGVDVIETGSGGSIPLVPMLDRTFPGIAVLMLGPADERSNTHSVNESVDLGELEHMALAEALFMQKLAARG
jgi:acetylornithine deacetylase/succinyl-diaminopimelate desuccinylase-like protein